MTDKHTLAAMVRTCIADTDTVREAAELLIERAGAVPDLWKQLMGSAEMAVAIDAVSRSIQDTREVIWTRPSAPDTRVKALVRANLSLLDFPLPAGLPLKLADAAAIREAVDFYKKQAADMAWKGRWLALVAASVPDGKTAGDVFDDAKLAALQKETK